MKKNCESSFLFTKIISMKLEFSRQVFVKYSNIEFHTNLHSSSPSCYVRTEDGQTDMSKLKIDFQNLANAHTNDICFHNSATAFTIKKVIVFTELFCSVLPHLFPPCFLCRVCVCVCVCVCVYSCICRSVAGTALLNLYVYKAE